MKRPSDQAKLVFLGLLRTVSALAGTAEPRMLESSWNHGLNTHHQPTWSSSAAAAASAAVSAPVVQQQQSWKSSSAAAAASSTPNTLPLTLRLARRTDVPSIQRCNLATLPENYNSAFYVQHLRQWPDLSLVVVDESRSSSADGNSRTPPTNNGISFSPFPMEATPPTVVAYVLGRVEERTVTALPNEDDVYNERSRQRSSYTTNIEKEEWGHITSLAVLHEYRRQGLAQALLEQLHHQLQSHYPHAKHVGLHVRQSNQPACQLYRNFGYQQAECIPSYYQDGEDGYYMVRPLAHQTQQLRGRLPFSYQPGLFSSFRPQPQQASKLALPRAVGRPQSHNNSNKENNNNNNHSTHSEQTPELMNGTF